MGAATFARALEETRPTRAVALASTFTAFRMLDNRKAQRIEIDAADLASAVNAAAGACCHKDHFVVVEADARTGTTTAHFHVVKRKAQGRWVVRDHIQSKVHDLYAEHLFSVDVTAFAPVEPWRWSPGADVVGFGDMIPARAERVS